MIEQAVLTEALAVVGGDDYHCPIEHSALIQFVKKPSQLLVKICEAIVVGIAAQAQVGLRQRLIVDIFPIPKDIQFRLVRRSSP